MLKQRETKLMAFFSHQSSSCFSPFTFFFFYSNLDFPTRPLDLSLSLLFFYQGKQIRFWIGFMTTVLFCFIMYVGDKEKLELSYIVVLVLVLKGIKNIKCQGLWFFKTESHYMFYFDHLLGKWLLRTDSFIIHSLSK